MAATLAASALRQSAFAGKAFEAPIAGASSASRRPLRVVATKAGTKRGTVKKAPANPEIAKWYGPARRLYLPEGILDRSTVPQYLTGEVPGDYGMDFWGLSKKPADFEKFRTNEVIHGRWAMLGALGCFFPEAANLFGAECGPEGVWWKTGATLLEGGTQTWFGVDVPTNLIAATVIEVALLGGAEFYRQKNASPLVSGVADPLYPGGPFDPLGLASDPDQLAVLKVKELKNGRLAMFAWLGYVIQAIATGDGPAANLAAHLDDPFANNILSTLGGAVERAPTL